MTDLKSDLSVVASLKSTIGLPSASGIHRLPLCGHDWAIARVLGDDMRLVSVKRQSDANSGFRSSKTRRSLNNIFAVKDCHASVWKMQSTISADGKTTRYVVVLAKPRLSGWGQFCGSIQESKSLGLTTSLQRNQRPLP
jgi:hypothetical protein